MSAVMIDCPLCDGVPPARGALSLVCPCCQGADQVPAACRDCVVADATMLCPDGQPRCDSCAEALSAAAAVLLRRIRDRPSDETVQRIIDGSLRLLQQVAT